jgi:hypothetical protein
MASSRKYCAGMLELFQPPSAMRSNSEAPLSPRACVNLLNGKINLPSLRQRQGNNQLTNADKTVLGLLDLAGIALPELMSEEGYETSRAKLEAIGLEITQEVFNSWKQNQELAVEFDIKTDPADAAPFNIR